MGSAFSRTIFITKPSKFSAENACYVKWMSTAAVLIDATFNVHSSYSTQPRAQISDL